MDLHSRQLFATTLKRAGYSVTKTRSRIFELLVGQGAQSIAMLINRGQGSFDRASLYRTIELFEKTGIVQRVYIGWKYQLELTDKFNQHHHHVSCLSCGRVWEIKEQAAVENIIAQLADQHGLRLISHQIEIQGYCQACQARAEGPLADAATVPADE